MSRREFAIFVTFVIIGLGINNGCMWRAWSFWHPLPSYRIGATPS